jgi:hypothetical protein
LWQRLEIDLSRVHSARDTRLKVANSAVAGRKLLQEITVRRSGLRTQADTLLFCLDGHLVAVTSYGRADVAPEVLKGIRKADARAAAKERTVRLMELSGSTPAATYLDIELPPGFRHAGNRHDETDRSLIARWIRSGAGPGQEILTLQQVVGDRHQPIAEVAAGHQKALEASGLVVRATAPIQIEDREAATLEFEPQATDSGSGGRGFVAVWAASGTYRALRWDSGSRDAEVFQAAKRQIIEMLEKAQLWQAPPGGM